MCNVFFSYTTYFYVLTKTGCRTKPELSHNELIVKIFLFKPPVVPAAIL